MTREPLFPRRRGGIDRLEIVHDDFRYGHFHNALLMTLTRTPTPTDVTRLRYELERLADARQERVVLVIQVGDRVGAPDAETRAAIGRLMQSIQVHACYAALVLEASGFWAATLRAVQAGIELSVGAKIRLDCCSCISEALAKAQPRVTGHPTDLELMVAAATVRAKPLPPSPHVAATLESLRPSLVAAAS